MFSTSLPGRFSKTVLSFPIFGIYMNWTCHLKLPPLFTRPTIVAMVIAFRGILTLLMLAISRFITRILSHQLITLTLKT